MNQKKPDPNEVDDSTQASKFIKKYYDCFDTDQDKMMSFHSVNSKLTFDGEVITGNNNQFTRFKSLGKVTHYIYDVEAQEACSNKVKNSKGLLVVVIGGMLIDGSM